MSATYFAYGSNLDEDQMRDRCGDTVIVAAGFLRDFRLAFTRRSSGWCGGVADVVPSPGSQVWGIIYTIPDEGLCALDRHEGYPRHYQRFLASIETSTDTIDAWTYFVVDKEEFVAPRRQYLDILRAAARQHGFPEAYMRQLDAVQTVPEL